MKHSPEVEKIFDDMAVVEPRLLPTLIAIAMATFSSRMKDGSGWGVVLAAAEFYLGKETMIEEFKPRFEEWAEVAEAELADERE